MNVAGTPLARATIMEAVENQLRDQDPPETQKTYDRLTGNGSSSEEAKRLIGVVLVREMNDMIKKKRSFDLERYVQLLAGLPKIPWK